MNIFMQFNGLMNWLQPRVGINPLRFVQKAELNGKNKRERRAITAEELERLCSVSGRRGFVHRIAARTGIRRGEPNEIEQRDIHLEAPLPFIVVRASISKKPQAGNATINAGCCVRSSGISAR